MSDGSINAAVAEELRGRIGCLAAIVTSDEAAKRAVASCSELREPDGSESSVCWDVDYAARQVRVEAKAQSAGPVQRLAQSDRLKLALRECCSGPVSEAKGILVDRFGLAFQC